MGQSFLVGRANNSISLPQILSLQRKRCLPCCVSCLLCNTGVRFLPSLTLCRACFSHYVKLDESIEACLHIFHQQACEGKPLPFPRYFLKSFVSGAIHLASALLHLDKSAFTHCPSVDSPALPVSRSCERQTGGRRSVFVHRVKEGS